MRSGKGLAVLLFVVLAQCLVGQRSPVFVTVIGVEGEPLVGAEVICSFATDLATPFPGDVVRATTDGRGRARCNLQVGRVYCAWAVGAKQVDGYYVSRVMQLVSSGRLITLDAQYWRTTQKVELHGVEAWRRASPVGLRWFPVATQDHGFDLALPGDGVVELPAFAWNDGCLALTSNEGAVLACAKVEAEGGSDVWFDEPSEVVARVTGGDDEPIAGATVEVLMRRVDDQPAIFFTGVSMGRLRSVVGVTKADGTVRFLAPPSVTFLASKTGYTPAGGRALGDGGPVPFRMRASVDRSFRFVGENADAVIPAASDVDVVKGEAGERYLPRPLPVTKVGVGKWTLPEPGAYLRLRAAVSAKVPRAMVMEQELPADGTALIYLAKHATVDVRVRDADGREAPCVIAVGLVSDLRPDWHAMVATSIGGAAQVVVPNEGHYFVYASTGKAHAVQFLGVGGTGTLNLVLEDIPTMRVHAVNNVGQSMVLVGFEYRGGRSGRPGQGGPATRQDLFSLVAQTCGSRYLSSVATDRQGIAHVPVFASEGATHNVQAVRGHLKSNGFRLMPGGDIRVTLR